jgi:Spy/CpxP family protein refolding chaperone
MSIYRNIPKKVVFIVAGLFIGASAVFAFSGYHKSEEKAEYIVYKITKKLDLNEAQQEKLNLAKDAMLEMRRSMRSEKRSMVADIQAILGSDTLDQQLILDNITKKTDMVREQAPDVVAAVADFYNSLDMEQQEKIRKKVNKKLRHIKEHHGYDEQ